jgi:hypothetical protein
MKDRPKIDPFSCMMLRLLSLQFIVAGAKRKATFANIEHGAGRLRRK